MSRPVPGLRRKDVIRQDQLWMITDQGQAISVSVVDESVAYPISPRYVNTVYSQKKSAENACARMNQEFNTDRFEVRAVKFE